MKKIIFKILIIGFLYQLFPTTVFAYSNINMDLYLFKSKNLFPQAENNNDFAIRGSGIFEVMDNHIYKYDYSQNLTWTWHAFEIYVDVNKYYTVSFDAYISQNANIQSTGTTFIANEEKGIAYSFNYDNTKKGTWQHFEYTAKPCSSTVRISLYPTTSTIPSTTGCILYKNVEFKTDNMYPQPKNNESFLAKANGFIGVEESYIYKYAYSQNQLSTYHGFDIPVNVNQYYTYSFDAYISPDANLRSTGSTFIANEEKGISYAFTYDNTKKGTWQHFEYSAKPSSSVVRLSLYPSTNEIPANSGYILYRNVEFKLNSSVNKYESQNLFPQVKSNNDFTIRGNGVFEVIDNHIYKYDYSQNLTWTWHGFEMPVDVNKYYTYSFDAYISPNANIQSTGTTFIANEEKGISHAFAYDSTKKGTWQHFEYTAKPSSPIVNIVLYPTTGTIPATTGFVLYKNVEFKTDNIYPQPKDDASFQAKANGFINVEESYIYRYDYSQNQPWTYHGFDIPVDINQFYTYSFDAYISPDANLRNTGTFIANEEKGISYSFTYDNTKKGTWQHFEYTAKPNSDVVRLSLYPSTSEIPANTGYILYKNVEFKAKNTSSIYTYEYDKNNRLLVVYINNQIKIKYYYDKNGNQIKKEVY